MAEETQIQVGESASTMELHGIKVLIVEDDNLISEVTLKELSSRGATVHLVADGAKAIEEITNFIPTVILLDLMLPNMNGEDILAKLKSDPKLQGIPVIVFSNRSEESDIEKIKELGAAEFFVKVSTVFSDLAKAIQKHAKAGVK